MSLTFTTRTVLGVIIIASSIVASHVLAQESDIKTFRFETSVDVSAELGGVDTPLVVTWTQDINANPLSETIFAGGSSATYPILSYHVQLGSIDGTITSSGPAETVVIDYESDLDIFYVQIGDDVDGCLGPDGASCTSIFFRLDDTDAESLMFSGNNMPSDAEFASRVDRVWAAAFTNEFDVLSLDQPVASQPFSLAVVPEPATCSLGLFGISLMLWRRRTSPETNLHLQSDNAHLGSLVKNEHCGHVIGRKYFALLVVFTLVGQVDSLSAADISFAGFTFPQGVFASSVQEIDPSTTMTDVELGGGASTLNEALTGFSKETYLLNIGFDDNANLFQLNFDTNIVNRSGPDFVLFDIDAYAYFGIGDHYEIAVRPTGGSFTPPTFVAGTSFINTGELLFPRINPPRSASTHFAAPLDLSSFGLQEGTKVDAITIKALPGRDQSLSNGMAQGDPTMVGVLSPDCVVAPLNSPEPSPEPFNFSDLAAPMQAQWSAFKSFVKDQFGVTLNETSGRRSNDLQQHFYDLAIQFDKLQKLNDPEIVPILGQVAQLSLPSVSHACRECVEQLNAELLGHGIKANSRMRPAVNPPKASNHPDGVAVDVSVDSVDALKQALINQGATNPDEAIKDLAEQFMLHWKGVNDEVHFEYGGAINNKGFNSGDLEGWNTQGPGTVNVVEREGEFADLVAQLTAGSPVSLFQQVDTPTTDFVVTFESAFISGQGNLEISINSTVIDTLNSADYLTSEFETREIFVTGEQFKGLSFADLRLHFDGPMGSQLLLDNIQVQSVPEPASFGLSLAGFCLTLVRRRPSRSIA